MPSGREVDDLVGRGYIEVRGELAARLLRGERATLPVALLDLGRDASAAVAATGASKLRAPKAYDIGGATAQLLAARSSVVAGGVYGKSDLEALVELTLLDCAAADLVPLGLLSAAAAAGRPSGAGGGKGPEADAAAAAAAAGGRALVRTPSASMRELAECSLLVLISAAEGLPLVKG
jgi:hypothetical protein